MISCSIWFVPTEDGDFKIFPAAANEILKGAPAILRMFFPKLASRSETHGMMARYLLEQAMRNPSLLSDADLAVIDDFLGEAAANWVKYRVVDAQAAALSEHLANSPRFLLAGDNKEGITDPSFDETIKAGIRATSMGDEAVLNLYASIKAGENIRPGSFSKLTVQTVSVLSREIIDLFEGAAKYVVAMTSPYRPLGLPWIGPTQGLIAYGELMRLAEYGLFSDHAVAIDIIPENPLTLVFGYDVNKYSCRRGRIKFQFYPVTLAGRELLRIHQCGEAENLIELTGSQIGKNRTDLTVQTGRLDLATGEAVFPEGSLT